MDFHIVDDGFGGFYAYEMDTDAGSGGLLLAICLIVVPVITLLMFGEYLLLPMILLLLGFLLLYTPSDSNIRQNVLLTYTKMALSVPLFAYGVTCIPYVMGKAADGTNGIWVLLTAVVGLIPLLLTTVSTHCLSLPLSFLWIMSFFATAGDDFPTATNFILHATYLEGVGIFIYGVVQAIMTKDRSGIHLLPKLIAAGLGCLPLILIAAVNDTSDWIVAFVTIAAFCGIYFAYHLVLRQPALFSYWLLFPFLALSGGYFMEHSYSPYIFPSDIIKELCRFLSSMDGVLSVGYRVCIAFSGVVSDILYGLMKFFFAILPDIGAYAVHVEIHGFFGGIIALVLIVLSCLLSAKLYRKFSTGEKKAAPKKKASAPKKAKTENPKSNKKTLQELMEETRKISQKVKSSKK